MKIAATDDETNCSANTTPPLPQVSSRTPTTAPSRHCRAVGRGAPRASSTPNSSAPAIVKRRPLCRNGGYDASASRIPKYVEPQTR